jgi:hypothetical protein
MIPARHWNAARGLQAIATTEVNLDLGGLAARNPVIVARLSGFSFPAVANAVGGLLTKPQNQPATFRLEALAALAAAYAEGEKQPTAAHLRGWLNGALLQDPIGQFEDPVEDVFVSNVPSWDGNARLFDGLWGDNDIGVEALVWSVMKLKDRPWAATALDSCMALLRLSEEVAARAGVERYAMSDGSPRRPLRIVTADLDVCSRHVLFTVADLFGLGLRAHRLKPFALMPEHRAAMSGEAIGACGLQRRPLVWNGSEMIVALPTAIGAAIRLYVLEQARSAGDLDEVAAIIRDTQFSEIHEFGLTGLRARTIRQPELFAGNCYDLVARFDEGAYLHLIYVGDEPAQILDQGLRSLQIVPGAVVARAGEVAARFTVEDDYRRGLTLVVHGGVGRGSAIPFKDAPPASWRRVAMEYGDFARISWEHGFDALRIWKVIDQEERLPERGYQVRNVNGFANLYGFLWSRHMEMVPDDASPGGIELAPDHVAGIRSFLRSVLDAHVAIGPTGHTWLEVRRSATDVFFEEVRSLPLYVSVLDMATQRWSSCVETPARPWWVTTDRTAKTPNGRSLEYQVWDMARNWMVRAASRLEDRLPSLPDGPVSIRIDLPDVDTINPDAAFAQDTFGAPVVTLVDGVVVVTCAVDQLAAFARAENIGERQVIAAFAEGAAMLAGKSYTQEELDAFALEVAGSKEARFFHMLPPRSPSMLVYSAAGLERPRLLQDEDIAWGRLGLAEAAGWTGGAGTLTPTDAPKLLSEAVDAIWCRMRDTLAGLDREALVTKALINHDAIAWDRINWSQTASALLALYEDTGDVVGASNRIEAQRAVAGLGSRIIAEMGVCACPEQGGRPVAQADFDSLLADIAILIECANQNDAIHWKLAADMPVVNPNGSLSFDTRFLETQQRPYVDAHGEQAFRGAARSYEKMFARPGEPHELDLDQRFFSAVEAEYGIGLRALARFTIDCSNEAASKGTNFLRLARSEVIARLAGDPEDFAAADPARAFETLTLRPRPQWDEPKPEGAKARDWYPWRFSRRLSLLQRPMIRIGTGADPTVLVLPTLLDNFVQRLFAAEAGSLPMDLYSSPAMRSWIGTAVDREGHDFNDRVADRLAELGWTTRADVKLTELGGTKGLGDVDVLAWHTASGAIVAIECKRLQVARSIGEIGERLAEYAELAPAGAPRTPIQKHLDRLAFLRADPKGLARTTGIRPEDMALRSALVTDHLVPMQFSKRAGALVDVIADYPSLATFLSVGRP